MEDAPKKPVGRPKGRAAEAGVGGESGGGDTRAAALDAAEAVLTARGYAGMSLEEVARRTGITKAALYHHFPGGKDGLILAVARRMIERDREGMARAIESVKGARVRMEAVAAWVFGEDRHSARMLRDAQRFLPRESAEEIGQRFLEAQYLPLKEVLDRGVSTGELRAHDTEFATWAFLSLLAEFAALSTEFPEEYPEGYAVPNLARRIVSLILDGVGHENEHAVPPGANPA